MREQPALPGRLVRHPDVTCFHRRYRRAYRLPIGDDMEVVVGVLLVWFVLALLVAVVIGRGIRLADACSAAERPITTAYLPAGFTPASSTSRR